MGIYLPKAKMPTTCALCWMFEICPIKQKKESAWRIERHPNCPIIEIKEPHGRLIDADELVRTSGVTIQVTGKENAIVVTQALDSIYQDIDDAPTVIEAES